MKLLLKFLLRGSAAGGVAVGLAALFSKLIISLQQFLEGLKP